MISDIKYGSLGLEFSGESIDAPLFRSVPIKEIDSERVFFSEVQARESQLREVEIAIDVDLIETEIQEQDCFRQDAFKQEPVAPRLDDAEFERRKKVISSAFHRYSQILIDRIEEQTTIILEKDREIKNLERQIRLLPDLEKQARQRDQEAKLAAFESAALKKQMALKDMEQITAEKVTRLSNSIIAAVEKKARTMQAELEDARLELTRMADLEKELARLKRPWWQRFLTD
ncbi:hypothetical protein GC174_15485 [bacterium]|nr:hypothetical protein [bacterium]